MTVTNPEFKPIKSLGDVFKKQPKTSQQPRSTLALRVRTGQSFESVKDEIIILPAPAKPIALEYKPAPMETRLNEKVEVKAVGRVNGVSGTGRQLKREIFVPPPELPKPKAKEPEKVSDKTFFPDGFRSGEIKIPTINESEIISRQRIERERRAKEKLENEKRTKEKIQEILANLLKVDKENAEKCSINGEIGTLHEMQNFFLGPSFPNVFWKNVEEKMENVFLSDRESFEREEMEKYQKRILEVVDNFVLELEEKINDEKKFSLAQNERSSFLSGMDEYVEELEEAVVKKRNKLKHDEEVGAIKDEMNAEYLKFKAEESRRAVEAAAKKAAELHKDREIEKKREQEAERLRKLATPPKIDISDETTENYERWKNNTQQISPGSFGDIPKVSDDSKFLDPRKLGRKKTENKIPRNFTDTDGVAPKTTKKEKLTGLHKLRMGYGDDSMNVLKDRTIILNGIKNLSQDDRMARLDLVFGTNAILSDLESALTFYTGKVATELFTAFRDKIILFIDGVLPTSSKDYRQITQEESELFLDTLKSKIDSIKHGVNKIKSNILGIENSRKKFITRLSDDITEQLVEFVEQLITKKAKGIRLSVFKEQIGEVLNKEGYSSELQNIYVEVEKKIKERLGDKIPTNFLFEY